MPFQKGHKLSVGNKPREGIELRNDLIMRVRRSKKEINEALIKQAVGGNTSAIREIFDRAVGKATEYVDITSGGQPIIYVDPVIASKNGLTPSTNKDSQ